MATTDQVLTKKVGPCGGSGGHERDMNTDGIIRIIQIIVCSGWAIDSLTVRFLRNNIEDHIGPWGGTGGSESQFNLEASEYITSITGHIGNLFNHFVVRSLKFETNMRTYGPYGIEEGIHFELPAIGGQIVGFHGRSGIYLDSLGVHIKSPLTTLTKKVGPCGGHVGSVRDMNTVGITRIVKIIIRHDTAIKSLTVHFQRNGRKEKTEQWGEQGGRLTEFKLGASEYITCVTGRLGNTNDCFMVKSLKFDTNLRSYGPYGEEEGIPFELHGINGQIIGFHGRSSAKGLCALGAYIKVNTLDDGLLRLRPNHGCFHTGTFGISRFLKSSITCLGLDSITTCNIICFHL